MDSALIVSSSEKGAEQLCSLLAPSGFLRIGTAKTSGEARRILTSEEYDLFIVNSPLPDESSDELARRLADMMFGEVLYLVREDSYAELSERLSGYGVICVSKPIHKSAFWSAVRLAEASHSRYLRMRSENIRLQQKIDDIRVIDRAKCILISNMKMTEPEAHKFIERQAMDRRSTRRQIADSILKTYEY
ncbi:MAG: ANTAR domain-containing protein [Oscillospiraceae bacterium]|jgi:response regulator NasT|nr:ANTAR domain-containing protein [Oscillospiraceae bacterium]